MGQLTQIDFYISYCVFEVRTTLAGHAGSDIDI